MAAVAPHHWSPRATTLPAPLRMRQFPPFSNTSTSSLTTSTPEVSTPTLVATCTVTAFYTHLNSGLELIDLSVQQVFHGDETCSSSGVFGSCLSTQGLDCSCIGGIGYLECVSAAAAESTCWGVDGVVACEMPISTVFNALQHA
jgi:hypothetical protein